MSVINQVLDIRMGRTGDGGRAPHKPLLLLYALGHLQREGSTPIVYSAAEEDLARLFREFAPPGSSGPNYPFHHLATDAHGTLWTVHTRDGLGSPGRTRSALRDSGGAGQFHPAVLAELTADPELIAQLAHAVLDANFPPSLHDDICTAVGLDLELAELVHAPRALRRRRDPAFRINVLRAYEHMCAFCGYEGRLDNGTDVALDAAHIRWHAFDGPDDTANGLCLCSIHHKLFDKGVLGLTEHHLVTVSAAFVGRTPAARAFVHDLDGRQINTALHGRPKVDHIAWHSAQVFRRPARRQASA